MAFNFIQNLYLHQKEKGCLKILWRGFAMKIDEGIFKIIKGKDLTVEETREIINEIVRGEANSTQIGGFLIGLRVKGETSNEVLGAVKALRDNMVTVDMENREHLIDTCGTGGDGGKTF